MAIIVITTDLMLTSALAGASQRLGETIHTLAPAGAPPVATEDAPAARLVVIDLASVRSPLGELVARWRDTTPRPAVIAFGPHVHEARLDEARQAGCDEVLTRGQFHARMDEILRGGA